jgi:3-deoxy-D-manno-octulosonate 8-phosphate phosphatase, yrbI family
MRQLKLFITDVDGTLTDGGMYYDEQGNEWKKFNTRDGKGLSLLQERGVKIMFLTSEDTPIVARRAAKLKIDFVCMGVKDKLAFLKEFFARHSEFSFASTAYIGDDVNDVSAMERVGIAAAPADAMPENKNAADYLCASPGGAGCVREFCVYLLQSK